jgi:iron complex outermembrane receptor protein
MKLMPKSWAGSLRFAAFAPVLAGSLLAYGAAFAQTTGQTTVDAVVVTAMKPVSISGLIKVQEAPKGKSEITQEFIATQQQGQNVLQDLNLTPGLTYTNDDPFGLAGSGGHLRLHGLDGTRIGLLVDGVPLNDSGNYAIYPGELVDPEVVESVSVNSGSADTDAPTASSVGGTINIKTMVPSDTFGGLLSGSVGSFAFKRIAGVLQTGEVGPWGTKAYVEVSDERADKYKGFGEYNKLNINAKVYQDLHHYGDFVSLAFFYDDQLLPNVYALDFPVYLADGTLKFPADAWNSDYLGQFVGGGQSPGVAVNYGAPSKVCAGNASFPANLPCTGAFFYGNQLNPTTTWNLRLNSKYTIIPEHLVLTVDPTFQSVLADGGSQARAVSESDIRLKGSATTFNCPQGGKGVDLNGDGDCLDTVYLWLPSLTHTERITINTSLIWSINPDQVFRVGYSYDHAHHRQDGPGTYLNADGTPECVYGAFEHCGMPVLAADGSQLQQRNRLSVMVLNQFTAEYIGRFFDEHLRIDLGVRDPHFHRDLNQYCYTSTNGFSVECGDITLAQATTAGFPIPPFKHSVSYTKPLPQAGVSWRFDQTNQVYFNFSEQYRLPVTDDLYDAANINGTLTFDPVKPESSETYELGYRFQRPDLLASITLWDTEFHNRIITTFDPNLDISIDRNVGDVTMRGVDLAAGWKPIQGLQLTGTFTYEHGRLDDDVSIYNSKGQLVGVEPLKGKFPVEMPKILVGGRAQYSIGDFVFGVQGKYTSSRWVTDLNDLKVAGFTVWDLDARLKLDEIHHPGSYVQFNVTNLFNARYYGSLNTDPTDIFSSPFYGGQPFASQGAPRTFMVTLRQTF